MKKYIIAAIVSSLLVVMGFSTNRVVQPDVIYNVYLEGELIGFVDSKTSFEKYMDEKSEHLKDLYKIEQIHGPDSLEIVKYVTYNSEVNTYDEVFKNITKPLTVEGFQITIHKEEQEEPLKINVNNLEVFEDSIKNVISSFIGTDNYQLYYEEERIIFEADESRIENVYLEDEITYRSIKIPINEEIYTSASELSKFLLFGTTESQQKYIVEADDTIESVAFKHEISAEEFLVSNPEFTGVNNLLYESQEVIIGVTDPQISVVVEEFVVEEVLNNYRVEVRYDENELIGYSKVVQKGEQGIEKLTRNVKTVNGVVVFSDLLSREEIKPSISQIVVKGEKNIPSVASAYAWTWPTAPGWTITSNYAYRIHPITRRRELHPALDIAIGYGAHIYASNNGVVHEVGYQGGYGNYVIIKHNNNANNYTLYAHLSRYIVRKGQVVSAGTLLGYMGSTGMSTGPHLHFELWVGEPHKGGYRLNPWSILR